MRCQHGDPKAVNVGLVPGEALHAILELHGLSVNLPACCPASMTMYCMLAMFVLMAQH